MLTRGIKCAGLTVMHGTGLFALARRLTRRGIRILSYHGVSAQADHLMNHDGFFVHPDVFRAQMNVLSRHFKVVSLSDVLDAVAGHGELPESAVAITFDDGYRNNLTEVAPILETFGFPATFFVTTGYMDRSDYPWWFRLRAYYAECRPVQTVLPGGGEKRLNTDEELIPVMREWERHLKNMAEQQREREMTRFHLSHAEGALPGMMSWDDVMALEKRGFSLAPHTVRHVSFGHENTERLREEIQQSWHILQRRIELPLACFSFPYGQEEHVTSEMDALLEAESFRGAVTDMPGMVHVGDNRYALHRIAISGGHDALAFDALVSGVREWL